MSKELKLFTIAAVLACSVSSFASNNIDDGLNVTEEQQRLREIQAKNDSVCAEGYNLFIAERINWMATDSVLSRYSQEELGGNVIWQPTDSTWNAIFIDKEIKNCIFEMQYNKNDKGFKISYDKRPITEVELAKLSVKNVMLENLVKKCGNKITYDSDCGSPNLDFVRIDDNTVRLYILQGTVHNNLIPFGNDYSADFNNDGEFLCFRQYHKSLIATKTVDEEGNPIVSAIHSHVKESPYITPTDVCNFLLYRGQMQQFYVLSTALDVLILYDAETNHTIVKSR